VKLASDSYAPVSGEGSAGNVDLDTTPEKINQSAYEAWIFKFKPADPTELAILLDAEGYQKLVAAQV
jgi:glycine cleavage system H protein